MKIIKGITTIVLFALLSFNATAKQPLWVNSEDIIDFSFLRCVSIPLLKQRNAMKKDTFYFPHDYNAASDEKIEELLFKLSNEGYGIYWRIIEMLYQNNRS